jgi:hypothetical protein
MIFMVSEKALGASYSSFFAVPLSFFIQPLLFTQLSIPSAACNKPNKTAHYHCFGTEVQVLHLSDLPLAWS